jgi:hypothetical protein
MTILPLRRLFIERQIQPEMLSFVPTEEVVALFDMCVSLSRICAILFLFCRDSYFEHLNVRSIKTRTSTSSDVPLDAL